MTKFIEREEKPPSSPNEEEQGELGGNGDDDERRNNIMEKLMYDLENISRGPRSFMYRDSNENWGPSRYLIGNDDGDETISENYSVLNYTDGDDDGPPIYRCYNCEVDIEFAVRGCLDDVHRPDPKDLVCPLCIESVGPEPIRGGQISSSRKRNCKSEKYISFGNSAMLERKYAAWGNKQEPMSDPLLLSNVSVPRCNDFQSSSSDFQSDEDTISVASDISVAKSSGTDAPDSGDEQDFQEKSMRAAFAQDLVLSTLFLD